MLRNFLRPRFKITNAAPKEVAFYYAQYMELMKYGDDHTDRQLKAHIYEIIQELGVPDRAMFLEDPPIDVTPLEPPALPEHLPIIHRNKCRPTLH